MKIKKLSYINIITQVYYLFGQGIGMDSRVLEIEDLASFGSLKQT